MVVESQKIEFKPNWRDEYLKVICAFANAEGGELIIGVDDKGESLGLKNIKKLLEDIPISYEGRYYIRSGSTNYLAGFIESWGRGTIKIVENCLQQGLPEPDFIEEYGVMKVVFYKDKFTAENLKKLGISARQIKAVMYVKEKGKITNNEYQALNIISKKTATRDMNFLVEKGIFEKVGITGKGTEYVIKGT